MSKCGEDFITHKKNFAAIVQYLPTVTYGLEIEK